MLGGAMGRLLSDKRVLDLVEHVYAAGCDPLQWPKFVAEAHASLPGTAFTTQLSLERTGLSSQSASSGIPDECIASYYAHYQFINPYIPMFGRFKVGEVQRLSQLLNPADVKKHVFYHEWLKPAGDFTHAAGIALLRDDRRLLRVSIDIPDRLGHLEEPAAELLTKLGPHITRAFEVNDRLKAATVTQGTLEGLIERIEGAAFVVGANGRISTANREGESLARQGSLVRVRGDKQLIFRHSEYQGAYQQALASAVDPAAAKTESIFRVSSTILPDATVTVLPLKPGASLAEARRGGAMVLVLIRELPMRGASASHLLQSLYRLTHAEAKVACLIADGSDTGEIAEALSISRTTVRNQIAAIFSKMGVHRQADLVRVVRGLEPRLLLTPRP
jgi:DNA-binding CsgD family transcriptional regulator